MVQWSRGTVIGWRGLDGPERHLRGAWIQGYNRTIGGALAARPITEAVTGGLPLDFLPCLLFC